MPRISNLSLPRRVALGAAGLVVAAVVSITAVTGPAWATGTTPAPAPSTTVAAPAGAPSSLAVAKAKVDARIDKALGRIEKVSAALARANGLSPGDRAGLDTKLSTLRQQLTAAKATADAAPTVAALRTDLKGVLASLKQSGDVAQVRATVVAAVMQARIEAAVAREPAVQARIAAAQAKGVTVTAAQAAFADLQAKLSDAHAKVSGLAAAVISGQTSPGAAKTALTAVAGDLKAARADLTAIRSALAG